jgi:hypothetical protein
VPPLKIVGQRTQHLGSSLTADAVAFVANWDSPKSSAAIKAKCRRLPGGGFQSLVEFGRERPHQIFEAAVVHGSGSPCRAV